MMLAKFTLKAIAVLFALALGACASNSRNASVEDPTGTKTVSFTTEEGTWLNIDVSPDGESLVFDLLGDLYMLPFGGGIAVPITSGMPWDQAARFSKSGKAIHFLSDRSGHKNVWRFSLEDGEFEQITRSPTDIKGAPNWSFSGGSLLAGVSSPGYGYDTVLHAINPATGQMAGIDEPVGPFSSLGPNKRAQANVYSGVSTQDGRIFFSEELRGNSGLRGARRRPSTIRLFEFDPKLGTRTALTPANSSYNDYKPQLSSDGKLLSYFRQYSDRRTELRIRNLVTGIDHSLTVLTDAHYVTHSQRDGSYPNYTFTPDGRHIVFWHRGQITKVTVSDGQVSTIPFHANVELSVRQRATPSAQEIEDTGAATTVRWPSFSADGDTLVFSAVGFVWVKDLSSGTIRRLTRSEDFEYMPALSPDGSSVAYISISQNEDGAYQPGRLKIADIRGEHSIDLVSDKTADFLLPKWAPDGSKIAIIRQKRRGVGRLSFGWAAVGEVSSFNEVASPTDANWYVSSQLNGLYAAFTQAGNKIVYSYPRRLSGDSLDTPEQVLTANTALVETDLDGNNATTLAIGESNIQGLIPSPDLKHLILARTDRSLWISKFTALEQPLRASFSLPDIERVSANAGFSVNWRDSRELSFGFGMNAYRYSVDDRRTSQAIPVRLVYNRPQADRPIVFVGARLITLSGGDSGVGEVIENGALVVEGTRIKSLGPASEMSVPDNAVIINVTGKTIMPGLIDTHYHYITGGSYLPFGLISHRFNDDSAIAYGVTSAWDPNGGNDDVPSAVADLQAAGRISGPRWFHGSWGSVGRPYELLDGLDAAYAAVGRQQELTVATVKEYLAPTREMRQLLATAAKVRGVGIVSHLDGFDGFLNRIVDGYTGGDHPHLVLPFYRDVSELLRQTGYIWTPNVVATAATTGRNTDIGSYFWSEAEKKFPDELRKHHAITGRQVRFPEPSVLYETHRISKVAASVANASENGVVVGVSAHDRPGSKLHQEMWYLSRGGMSNADILRATMMTNAEKIGLQEEVGSLEVGKVADFLILDENPLDDILNTLSIEYTIQGGVIYNSDTAEKLHPSDLPECALGNEVDDVCRQPVVH